MKKIVYLIAVVLFTISCDDSNILEPNPDFQSNIVKQSTLADQMLENEIGPIKRHVNLKLSCNYSFNPEAPNGKCGDFTDKSPAQYNYETETERSIRNLRYYSPSRLVIGEKTYRTCNLYTINKQETLDRKGNVINGTTWGTFKVVLRASPPSEEKILRKVYNENVFPIVKFGKVLFEGKFNGNIKNNVTQVSLAGKGYNSFSGSTLSARESMICGGDFCWKSNISGKVKLVEKIDQ